MIEVVSKMSLSVVACSKQAPKAVAQGGRAERQSGGYRRLFCRETLAARPVSEWNCQSIIRASRNKYHSSNTHRTYTRSTSHTQAWPPSDPQQGASSLLRFSTPDPLSSRRSAASPPQSTNPQPSQQHHQNLDLPPSSPTVSMPALRSATLLAAKLKSPSHRRKRSSSRPSKSAPKAARDHTPVCQSG